jgi:hypothetical protein
MPVRKKVMTSRRFSAATIQAFDRAAILGVRAGATHRYTGVWVVVVEGRVFVRSWNDKPTGWFRAFQLESAGTVQLGEREIRVRGVVPRSDRIRAAVTAAYGEKYKTKGSQKWVTGFAAESRLLTTLEFVPR